MNIELSGQETLLALSSLVLILVAFIFSGRYLLGKMTWWANNSSDQLSNRFTSLNSRVKYAQFDAFLYTGYFRKVGLFLAILSSIIAMSWTTYQPREYVLQSITEDLGDIEIIPPQTYTKPKPPPPPPPLPEIEEVEDIPEDEDIEFLDQDLTADEVINEEIPVPEKAAPPPPDPAPMIEEPIVDEIYPRSEVMPRFPGCATAGPDEKAIEHCSTQAMLGFIYKHLKYPPIARENGVEGTVVLRFVIDESGLLTHVEILRDIGAGCGKEAARVIQAMSDIKGKWTPGLQRGQQVKVMYTLPIKYKLQG